MLPKLQRLEPLNGDDVLGRLRGRLPGPMRGATLDTALADLPLDSLDVVDLLCLVDDEFGVRFDQGTFAEFRTVGDLADVVARAALSRHAGARTNGARS